MGFNPPLWRMWPNARYLSFRSFQFFTLSSVSEVQIAINFPNLAILRVQYFFFCFQADGSLVSKTAMILFASCWSDFFLPKPSNYLRSKLSTLFGSSLVFTYQYLFHHQGGMKLYIVNHFISLFFMMHFFFEYCELDGMQKSPDHVFLQRTYTM